MVKGKLLKLNQRIEKGVVGRYNKIEHSVVETYLKIEGKFVAFFLAKENESAIEAKRRIVNNNQGYLNEKISNKVNH